MLMRTQERRHLGIDQLNEWKDKSLKEINERVTYIKKEIKAAQEIKADKCAIEYFEMELEHCVKRSTYIINLTLKQDWSVSPLKVWCNIKLDNYNI